MICLGNRQQSDQETKWHHWIGSNCPNSLASESVCNTAHHPNGIGQAFYRRLASAITQASQLKFWLHSPETNRHQRFVALCCAPCQRLTHSAQLEYEPFTEFLALLRVSEEDNARFKKFEDPPFDEATLRAAFAKKLAPEPNAQALPASKVIDMAEVHLRQSSAKAQAAYDVALDREAAQTLLEKVASEDDRMVPFDAYAAFVIATRDLLLGRSSEALDAFLTVKLMRSRHRERLMRVTRTTVLHNVRMRAMTLEEACCLSRDIIRVLLPPNISSLSLEKHMAEAEALSRTAVKIELDSALLEATHARLGEYKDSRQIIARGANVNLRCDKPPHETVLSRAVAESNFDMATALLDAGADANAVDDEGTTSLMRLVTTPNPALKLIKRFIAESASTDGAINRARHDGATALIMAATFGRSFAVTQLIEHGADVSCQMTDGTTALMRAAQFGFPAVVEILCQAKANIHATNQAGRSALDLAILSNRSERVIDQLKSNGAHASHGTVTSRQQIDQRRSKIRPAEKTSHN